MYVNQRRKEDLLFVLIVMRRVMFQVRVLNLNVGWDVETVNEYTNSVRKDTNDKRVTINGEEFYAFIDTGSQCSMIRKSRTSGIRGERKPCQLRISGVWGGTCVLREMINSKVTIDNIELDVNLYVAEDEIFSTDLIIGNDIFENNNVSLIVNDNEQCFELNQRLLLVTNVEGRRLIEITARKCSVNDDDTEE